MVLRLSGVLLLGLVAAGVLALALGFLSFSSGIASLEKPALSRPADAIVALTGGAARIGDAVELLNQGRAGRLLITGVHPETTAELLAHYAPGREQLFSCCVDLGYEALNTVGNAKEARNWARHHGYRTLIIVTSSYHVPRSLNEMRREMPEAQLIAYPVAADNLPLGGWWRSPDATRLLLSEYAKYLLSIVRLRWRPATVGDVAITTAYGRNWALPNRH